MIKNNINKTFSMNLKRGKENRKKIDYLVDKNLKIKK